MSLTIAGQDVTIPEHRRQPITTAMTVPAKRIGSLLRHSVLDVWTMEGEFDGEPLKMLVADDGSTLQYIARMAFSEGAKKQPSGTVSTLLAHQLTNVPADIVVVGANLLLQHLYRSKGFFIVPKWVRHFLHVWERPEVMYSESDRATRKYFRRMVRTVEDGGLTYDVTRDPQWFDHFYFDMYRPYALSRHGDLAVIHSYSKIRSAFERGAGIDIKKCGQSIAGAIVFRYDEKTLCTPHMGIAGGCIDAARSGVNVAIDYYVVSLAHSLGCSLINFGHTRPFLSDGVLRYKMNWKMEVEEDDDGIGMFAIAAPGLTEQAKKFISANRFFHVTKEGLKLYDG